MPVPRGERVLVRIPLTGDDDTDPLSRMKVGTANYLGLVPIDNLLIGRGNRILRGAKGTKSFDFLFSQEVTVNGTPVREVSVPVPSNVTVVQMYRYARTLTNRNIRGIRTPHGISYNFGTAAVINP